jgi:glycosyltransferase involved in cell wall biosynthesis
MNVALVVKATGGTQCREDRNMGYWSYPVPEFEWKHFLFGGRMAYVTDEMNERKIIFQEDAGPRHFKRCKRPIVYLAIDGTLSDDHLQARLERAGQASMILVDHGQLENYAQFDVPVRRLNYCVNDHLMKDYGEEKSVDVSFHCGGGGKKERRKIRSMLSTYCKKRGLVYRSGVMHPVEYARAMARSKIVVNWPRALGNRSHRVFDAMACGACLVTGTLPDVDGDERVKGRDYAEVSKIKEIPDAIDDLLGSDEWIEIAARGKKLVAKYHTWAIRARQLRQIIDEELTL